MFLSILDIMRNFAKTDGDKLCIADEQDSYTYLQVIQNITVVAERLKHFGVKNGDRVVVCCTQNASFLFVCLACSAIGAVYVPVEQEAAEERIIDIVEETEATLTVLGGPGPEGLIGLTVNCIELTIPGIPNPDFEFVEQRESDLSELLFTTGSTGKSKGIEITCDNDVALAENIAFGTGMREYNVELIPLPMSHSHALRTFYANMLKHGAVVITKGVSNVRMIYNLLRQYQVTAIDLSPAAAMILLRLSRGKFSEFNKSLDYIELGTSVLPESVKDELKRQFPDVRLYNCYGSTESGRSCTLNFNTSDDEPFCIGRPSVNATFVVVDEQKNEIVSSANHTGLLACKGRMNMRGYWKQSGLTTETLQNGFVYTNDEGYINSDGRIFMLGRRGDVINFKGIKIAPDEIEEVVMKFEGVMDCAIIPEKDEAAGQIPVLVLKTGGKQIDTDGLAEYLAKHLDTNKQPRKIVYFDNIPRTYNGKLQRQKLAELLKEQRD